ncbi:outer membrane receptor protein [Paenibacillus popilliae ATCC 14706]|uniref:Outer membrane receptor protein n=1 Tax=Paenibacillus popilliae ATCC 14706 TaxID=1212764 RepID=M9LPT7_PAEPP|nr:outer membrane receptor protein [Paenibacillus popilliae ATCC 14706]
MEPRKNKWRQADVVTHTEGNIGSSVSGEFESALRGLRAWHVTNRELAGTRETLSLLGTSGYAVQVKTKY